MLKNGGRIHPPKITEANEQIHESSHMGIVEISISNDSTESNEEDEGEEGDDFSVAGESTRIQEDNAYTTNRVYEAPSISESSPTSVDTSPISTDPRFDHPISSVSHQAMQSVSGNSAGLKSIDQLRTPQSRSRSSSIHNGDDKSLKERDRVGSVLSLENSSTSSPFSKLRRLASRLHDDDTDSRSAHDSEGDQEEGKKKSHFFKGLTGISSSRNGN